MRSRGLAATCAALMTTTALPAWALPQQYYSEAPPPIHSTVSGSGGAGGAGSSAYDFAASDYAVTIGAISIGANGGGLSFSRTYRGTGFRDSVAGDITFSGTNTYTVSVGGNAEAFSLSGATYAPVEVNGSSLTLSGSEFTYTTSNGTVYKFTKTKPALRYQTSSTQNGALLTQIIETSGRTIDYAYATTSATIGGTAYTAFRISQITTTDGYKLTPTYASATLTAADYTTYHWLTSVTLSNLADTSLTQSVNIVRCGTTLANDTPGCATYVNYIVDPSGLALATKVDFSSGQLTSIQPPTSGTTSFSYSTNTLTAITDGISTTYSYTDSGSTRTTSIRHGSTTIRSVTTDTGSGQITLDTLYPTSTTALATIYAYYTASDGSGAVKGRLQSVTNPELDKVSYAYDARGNVTKIWVTPKPGSGLAAYDRYVATYVGGTNPVTMNLPATTKNERGKVTNYYYLTNATTGRIEVKVATSPAPSTGADRPQIRWDYSPKTPYYSGAPGPVQIYTLDEVSTCSTGAAASGTAQLLCNNSAQETKVNYFYGTGSDAKNLLPSRVTQGSGNDTGPGAVSTGTSFTYNALGDVVSINGPLPASANDWSYFRYDSLRRRTGSITPDPDGSGGSLLPRAERVYYNGDGSVAKVEHGTESNPTASTWGSTFVVRDRVTSTWSQGRKTRDVLYAGGGDRAVTQYYYDSWGRLQCTAVRMTPAEWSGLPTTCVQGATPADRLTRTSYDNADRATQVDTLDASNAAVRVSSQTYNGNGTVATFTDGNNNTTTYTYDGRDRVTRVQYPDATFNNGTDQGSGSSSTTDDVNITYTVDATNNYVTTVGRDDQTNIVYYDDLDRLKRRDRPGSEVDLNYSYDNLGRLLSVKSATAADDLTFTYDALGRQLTQTATIGSTATTLTSEYDAAGRRTKLDYGDGLFLTYGYLVTGELAAIHENGAAADLVGFSYDQMGRRSAVTRPGGYATTYAWNDTGTLNALDINLPGTTKDLNTDFTYNAAFQVESRTRTSPGTLYVWPNEGDVNRTYTRNGKNQYTGTTSTVKNLAFGYSGRGDLTSEKVTTESQPLATYEYSSEGFLTKAKRGPGGSDAPTTVATLWYDNLDRLDRAAQVNSDRRFRYDGTDLIAEYNATGTLIRRYIHGPGDDEPLMVYEVVGSNTIRTYLYADERGSIIAGANLDSGAVTVNSYDEYGIAADTNQGLFQYTGQAWLADLGMSYYKARIYSPTLGRFLQTDPIGTKGGINLYGYTGNDPINGVDSAGTCKQFKVTGSNIIHCVTQDGDVAAYNQWQDIAFRNGVMGAGLHINENPQPIDLRPSNMRGVQVADGTIALPPSIAGALGAIEPGVAAAFSTTGSILSSLLLSGDSSQEKFGYHYTNYQGILSIQASGVIKANNGKVYFTNFQFSPSQVENNIFIGNPRKRGFGDFVVGFRYPTTGFPASRDPSVPFGWVHPGSIRNGKGGVTFVYVGRNNF